MARYAEKDPATGRYINPVSGEVSPGAVRVANGTVSTPTPIRVVSTSQVIQAMKEGRSIALPSGIDINKRRALIRGEELKTERLSGELTPSQLRVIENKVDTKLQQQYVEKQRQQSKEIAQTKVLSNDQVRSDNGKVSFVDIKTGQPRAAPIRQLNKEQVTTGFEDVLASRVGLPVMGAFGSNQKSLIRDLGIISAQNRVEAERKQSLKEIAANAEDIRAAQKGYATDAQYQNALAISNTVQARQPLAALTGRVIKERGTQFDQAEKAMAQSEARLAALRSVAQVKLSSESSRAIRGELVSTQYNIQAQRNIMLKLSGQSNKTSFEDYNTAEQANLIFRNEPVNALGIPAKVVSKVSEGMGIATRYAYEQGKPGAEKNRINLEARRSKLLTKLNAIPESQQSQKDITELNKIESAIRNIERDTAILKGGEEFFKTPTEGGKAIAFGLGIGAAVPLVAAGVTAVSTASTVWGAAGGGILKGALGGAALSYGAVKAQEYGKTKTNIERGRFIGKTGAELAAFTIGALPGGLIAAGGKIGTEAPGIKLRKSIIEKVTGETTTVRSISFEGSSGAQPLVSLVKERPQITKLMNGRETFPTAKEIETLPFRNKATNKVQFKTPKIDFLGSKEFPLTTTTEAAIVSKAIPKEAARIKNIFELSRILGKTKSKFISKTFTKERVESLTPEQVQIVLNFAKKKDARPFGGFSQMAQQTEKQFFSGRGKKTTGDIDLQLIQHEADLNKDTDALVNDLNKVVGGFKVNRNEQEPFLLESNIKGTKKHALDLKAVDTESTTPETFLSKSLTQPSIRIGGLRTSPLSEQALRKGGSIMTLRSNVKDNVIPELGIGKSETDLIFSPASHRAKDIGDYFSSDTTLIESLRTDKKRVRATKIINELKENYPKDLINPKSESKPMSPSEFVYGKTRLTKSVISASGVSRVLVNSNRPSYFSSSKPSKSFSSIMSGSPSAASRSPSIKARSLSPFSKSPSPPVSKSPSPSFSKLSSLSASPSSKVSKSPSVSSLLSPSLSPSISPSPKTPPPTFFTGGGFDIGGLSGGFGRSRNLASKEKKGYTPSLRAILFGITGRPSASAIASGVGDRPILISRKRKRRR